MKKLMLSLFAACAAAVGYSANHDVASLSTLDSTFYFEGDTLTLPAGSYTTVGDAVATVADNVVTCKKAGFTLVNDGSADHRLCVVPQPPAGGDVFYYFSNNGNGDNWTSVTWTKVTQNTDHTIPNGANDVAVIEGGCTWAKMLINDDISLHGYVVGVPKGGSGTVRVQLEAASTKTLSFCGSEADPAFFNFSSMYPGECGIRLGKESGNADQVLNIYVAAKRMNFDWCGDSASVASSRRGKAQIQWCSAIVTVPEGNTLAFVNDSKVVTDSILAGNTSFGHISGSGTVVFGQSGGIPLSLLKYAGDEFAGDIAAQSLAWSELVSFPDAVLTVIGAPNAGRKMVAIGEEHAVSGRLHNPGCNQLDVKAVVLDGGCLKINRNDADRENLTPWTEGATTDEEKAAMLTVTNEIKNLTVIGDSALYCDLSHGTTRVRQHAILDKIEHDKTGTLCLYDFNFRNRSPSRTDPLNFDRVKGAGLAPYAVGRDRQDGDSEYVYKIIPWIACTINDNGQMPYDTWGAQMGFPALVDGSFCCVVAHSVYPALADVTEWDNVHFTGKGISGLAGKTINSFSYDTSETTPYPGNLVLGEGAKLTIKSGGMIFARQGRWFGVTQTSHFSKNGFVEFGGDRAYLISDYGCPYSGDNPTEWNTMWAQMIAPNGLTKGGCGELVFAADQRGIDGDIAIGGGTLWLGHPANYQKQAWLYSQQAANSETIPVRGCATDVEEFTLRPGAVLGVPLKGYDVDGSGTIDEGETAIARTAVIRLFDNVAGTSKIEIAPGADQTCLKLFANGKSLPRGTYGATGSGAANIDDEHFLGTGVLQVRKDECVAGTWILVR